MKPIARAAPLGTRAPVFICDLEVASPNLNHADHHLSRHVVQGHPVRLGLPLQTQQLPLEPVRLLHVPMIEDGVPPVEAESRH